MASFKQKEQDRLLVFPLLLSRNKQHLLWEEEGGAMVAAVEIGKTHNNNTHTHKKKRDNRHLSVAMTRTYGIVLGFGVDTYAKENVEQSKSS